MRRVGERGRWSEVLSGHHVVDVGGAASSGSEEIELPSDSVVMHRVSGTETPEMR